MYLSNNMFYNHRKRENRKTKAKDAAVGVCLLDNVVTHFRNEYWNVTCNMAYCCIDYTGKGNLFVSCFFDLVMSHW